MCRSLTHSAFSLSFPSTSVPLPYKALSIPFPISLPKSNKGVCGSAVSSPSGVRAETRSQTHFDASTGLKTHLVAASFSFPQHFL